MKRRLIRMASVLFLVAGNAGAAVWNARRSLPYNGEGRYFDPATGMVIEEQLIAGIGTIALTCIALSLGVWIISRKR